MKTKTSNPSSSSGNNRTDHMLAHVAMLYYKDSLTQDQIAQRMGVSRATVVNYLRLAREQNIVDIRINGSSFTSSTLSTRLKQAFELEDVFIASGLDGPAKGGTTSKDELVRQVARVGAMALFDMVGSGETLGVAWGHTIQAVCSDMPRKTVRGLRVCQMIGSMESPLLALSAAETCAIRVATSLGAVCHTLHAPAILSTATLAKALRAEPTIKSQLGRLQHLDRAVFSVGDCDPDTHIVQSGIASAATLKWYRSKGAVGVLCGRFIDEQGRHVVGKLDERMIGISLPDLRRCRFGILVVAGTQKIAAIKAALAGGYVTHLVIDEAAGNSLLESWETARSSTADRQRCRLRRAATCQ
jgi:deoxyribonucleoside regulator